MFKIAGKDFYEYVAYRLKKDKLGFIPGGKWGDGCTDRTTYIKTVVPKSAYDFLVYAHELGHCKSEQFISNSNAFFSWEVDHNRLHSEFNAWVWAIRYIKKLKIEVSNQEWTDALKASFKSYTREYNNAKAANDFIERLNDMLGISLEMESARRSPCWEELRGKLKECVVVWDTNGPAKKPLVQDTPPSNKKHKPWMDLLDNQRKKHQRNSRKFA